MKSAPSSTPEFIGGPLCGDAVPADAPPLFRIVDPWVGGKSAARNAVGTYVYAQVTLTGHFEFIEWAK